MRAPGTLALLGTVAVPDDFPALPFRTGEDLVVRLGRTAPDAPAVQVVRAAPTPRSWWR